MDRLSIYSDVATPVDQIRRHLAGFFEVRFLGLERIMDLIPERFTVVNVSLKETSHLLDLREWLKRKPKDGKAIFVIDKASRIEITRAYAIGATDILHRPIDGKELLAKLCGGFSALAGDTASFYDKESQGVAAAVDTLQSIFSSACLGQTIDPQLINSASGAIVGQIDTQGLRSWIDTVRKHHSQTYQHCLLVTGLAVAFGQQIGVSRVDKHRLSFAGMLHDIGKARIPLEILEKPGPLDQIELAVMRQHPQLGIDALGTAAGLDPDMTDMVVHHHEYLDGSGYPHKLQGNEISDLVRIITIADVFGALIERRSYKPPLWSDAAYQILLDMGPKLDKDLVRAFRFTSQLDLQSKAS